MKWSLLLQCRLHVGQTSVAKLENAVIWLLWGFTLQQVRACLTKAQDMRHMTRHLVCMMRGPIALVTSCCTAIAAASNCLCCHLLFHSAAAAGVIQTDNYYSAWRCRTIPSPWDTPHSSGSSNLNNSSSSSSGPLSGGQPACELVLLHHDELKVPESLARMAIKLGMWKVCAARWWWCTNNMFRQCSVARPVRYLYTRSGRQLVGN